VSVEIRDRLSRLHFKLRHVVLHKFNLSDEAVEVRSDGREELVQAGVDFFHLLFDTRDALLELLPEVGTARFRFNKKLLGADVRKSFAFERNVVVCTSLVDNFDVRMLMFHNFVFDVRVVAVLGIILDLSVDLRVLRENLLH
jgi:hypothetical protein